MKYVIYTKSNCPQCKIAKAWLAKDPADEIQEVSLDDPAIRSLFMEAYPNIKSVPVVFDEEGNLVVEWKGANHV